MRFIKCLLLRCDGASQILGWRWDTVRNGSKAARRVTFSCFPLFLSKSKSISGFASSDLNFSSLCRIWNSLVTCAGRLLRWHFPSAFSEVSLAAPYAGPAVRSECLVRQVGQELGAWMTALAGLGKSLLLSTLSLLYFLSREELSASVLSRSLLKQLAENRFAFVY